MIQAEPLLVSLVRLVDELPERAEPAEPKRGRPRLYTDRLILKAVLIMIVRRLYSASSLLSFLNQETALTQALRELLMHKGQLASRRTWERRLKALPESLPGEIGQIGQLLVKLLHPWQQQGHAVAIDSTPLRAKGGVWHKKQRDQGLVPHSTIDTEAGWSKSGYHGWWYGWKLHLVCAVTTFWLPLAADLTVANTDDASVAPTLLRYLPAEVRYILGDTHYNTPDLRRICQHTGRWLVATRRGQYPHTDSGVEVRRIFHKLRSQAIEPFNGLFKNIFECGGQVPVKGISQTRLFVLGAVLLYQLVLLFQFRRQKPLGLGVKALLRAA
jgi:transposase